MKVRTSISLPKETFLKIAKFSGGLYNPQELALLCLRKMIRKMKTVRFSERPTACYNSEPVDIIWGIRLTPEEHYNLKMYRILTGMSISYLTALAIDIFICGMLRVLNGKIYKIGNFAWLQTLKETLTHIHRKVAFNAADGKKVLGLHLVLPKTGASWPMKFQPFPVFRSIPEKLRAKLGIN